MNIEIIELKKSDIERYNVKEFLFDMVKKCYDLDYVATSAIRSYDRDYNVKNRTYSREHTASFHRVFVHPDYRHCKIGSELVEKLENFCIEKHYNEIYLHTSEKSYGALSFWQYNNFEITYDTHDDAGTIHMEKVLV